MVKRVVFFTGNRAEFGLIFPIVSEVARNRRLTCEFIIGSQEKSGPLPELQNIPSRVRVTRFDISQMDGSPLSEAFVFSDCLQEMIAVLNDMGPELAICYGDRFETFAFGLAAFLLGIPIAHIEGGDITNGGVLDDQFRHALSKFSTLHFATNDDSAAVISQLGELPERIFNVGSTTVDFARSRKLWGSEEILQQLPLKSELPLILFTLHPAGQSKKDLDEVFGALRTLASQNIQVLITPPNADRGFGDLVKIIDELSSSGGPNVLVSKSLGHTLYLSLLRALGATELFTGACVGNSSSVVKDTPVFGTPAVLIGNRQDGRMRSRNVLRVTEEKHSIIEAVERALFDSHFRHAAMTAPNPYGDGNAAKRISEILNELKFPLETRKKFVKFANGISP